MRIGWLMGILMSFPIQAQQDFDREQIQQRISPVGKVRIQQSASPQPIQPAEASIKKSKEKPGEQVYHQYCSVCHQNGVAGAPKFHVESDWKSRMDTKKIAGLTASAIKGLNAMPPKGTCSECTEDQIREAVEYMVPQ